MEFENTKKGEKWANIKIYVFIGFLDLNLPPPRNWYLAFPHDIWLNKCSTNFVLLKSAFLKLSQWY